MLIKCLWCGKLFEPKKEKQRYCCKEHYRHMVHKKEKKERLFNRLKSFPTYRCWNCKTETKLDFKPDKDIKRFMSYACPHCLKRKDQEAFDSNTYVIIVEETTIVQESIY